MATSTELASQYTRLDGGSVKSAAAIPSFCIILPMYNEEQGARDCIVRIAEFLQTVPCRTAIIAVNDGSTDNTGAVLFTTQETVPCLIVETRKVNGGYGGANRTGFEAAIRERFDYAIVMDADGTQDPMFIARFFGPMCNSIDFIKATRYSPTSQVQGVPFKRRAISWLGNKLARLVLRLPITDYTNGFRAIKTDILTRLHTKERGFSMLIEEVSLAKQLGATFAEVPYTLTARTSDGSKSKFTYSWSVYRAYLKHLVKK